MDATIILLETTHLHGYEILKDIQDEFGEIRLSTFYRWLRELETSGMIIGTTTLGQRGPIRKIYSLTQSGRNYLLELVRDSIKIILNFYERYKLFSATQFDGLLTKYEFPSLSGRVLFAGMSRIHGLDIGTFRYISKRVDDKTIEVVGDAARVSNIGAKHKSIGGTLVEIPVRDGTYCEIWVSGTPKKRAMPDIIRECARALKPEGVLRLIVPFMFSKSSEELGIGNFIQFASLNLFPEFDLIEQEDLIVLLHRYFSEVDMIQAGFMIFLGRKSR